MHDSIGLFARRPRRPYAECYGEDHLNRSRAAVRQVRRSAGVADRAAPIALTSPRRRRSLDCGSHEAGSGGGAAERGPRTLRCGVAAKSSALAVWLRTHIRCLISTTTAAEIRSVKRSPKQKQAERRRDWYPYYAGFSAEFARHVLKAHLNDPGNVLDPWSGSGTTMAVAAEAEICGTGIDLNPAMTVIARARLHPANARDGIMRDARRVEAAIKGYADRPSAKDPLLMWFKPAAASVIRAAAGAISEVGSNPSGSDNITPSLRPSFLLAGLMAGTRDLLMAFRSTNPSWLAMPLTHRHRLSPSPEQISSVFLKRCNFLLERLTVPSWAHSKGITIRTGATCDLADVGKWEACLTSPPYATRVDYVRGTAPELAVLGITAVAQHALRRTMTGTPLVKGRQTSTRRLRSSTAQSIVGDVLEHPSHGSAGYYGPWIANYFTELEDALLRMATAVRSKGRIGLIVQDSQYKEIHVDLQAVVTETLEASGRTLVHREDHVAPHLMSHLNARARLHKEVRKNHESLLVFG